MDENTKKIILDFMNSNTILSLSTSTSDSPYICNLFYVCDDDLNIYFATHKQSHKAQKLLRNPFISLSVWEHKKMLVQADGQASELSDETQRLQIIDKLAESSLKGDNFWPPLFRIGGQDYIVFKIKLNWIRKLDLVRDTMTQIESPFTEVNIY